GRLGLEIGIARVSVAVAEPGDRADRARAPGITLVEIWAAVLACKTDAVTLLGIGLKARQHRSVEIYVAARAARRVECLGKRIDAVVTLHGAGVHPERIVSNADQRYPLCAPEPLPFRKCAELGARGSVDVDESERHPCRRTGPSIVERLRVHFVADAQRAARR